MNGSASAHEEARSALQALLAASKATRTEQPNGEREAGAALRQLFRADIQKALRPPPATHRLAELEAQLAGFLEQASGPQKAASSSSFQPPPREAAAPAEAPSPGQPQGEELDEELPPEPLPHEERPRPPCKLVIEEISAAGLREQVAVARRHLYELDGEVTRLTRELKGSRAKHWSQQQLYSSAEARISRIIAARSAELAPEALEEERRLEREEHQLRQSLGEARARASRWYAEAKHQDGILQQERDATKGGDAQSILAKHPAGEVFLPSFPSDNDSDEDYYPEGVPARRGFRPSTAGGGAASPRGLRPDSSDEEDDEEYERARGGGGGGRVISNRMDGADSDTDRDLWGASATDIASHLSSKDRALPPPPPAPRQFRATRDDEEDSEGSSLPSPSGGSGSMSGGLVEKNNADVASRALPNANNKGAPRPDSSSEEEDEEPRTAWNKAGTVPPLPQALNSNNLRGEDEAKEISSADENIDDIDDVMDSSRSV